MRACWVALPQPTDPVDRRLVAVGPGREPDRDGAGGATSGRRPRTFVPVEASAAGPVAVEEPAAGGTTDGAVARASAISPAPGTPGRIPGTWWLWGDPEPWPDL